MTGWLRTLRPAVYSFGLAMWEVIHNDFAFSGFDDLLAFREVP
jgi:hypothetical protein